MLEAVQELPLNFGFLGKGNDSLEPAMMEQIAAGAWGVKLNEHWGSTTIDAASNLDGKTDTQFAILTDRRYDLGNCSRIISHLSHRTCRRLTRTRYYENCRRKKLSSHPRPFLRGR
jgi:urease subunit alpha